MRAVAKTFTAHDEAWLDLIKRCSFVTLDADGSPCLESDVQVPAGRVRRLIALGKLSPSGDALPWGQSQTWHPSDEG